ncbi:MAG: hypothetical protein R2828_20160 [Saprospiraceae bacterium]
MMKTLKPFLFFSCLCLSFAIQAQSVVGKWKMTIPTDQGTMDILLDIKADNTYSVDLGNDGAIDVNGKYVIDSDQISITDSDGPASCPGNTGVYKFTVSATDFMMSLVSDPCEGRGGPEGKMAFKKA